jgi:hypothetical protein
MLMEQGLQIAGRASVQSEENVDLDVAARAYSTDGILADKDTRQWTQNPNPDSPKLRPAKPPGGERIAENGLAMSTVSTAGGTEGTLGEAIADTTVQKILI